MGGIYRFLGLSVGYVQQSMSPAERRAAYACDITYATANEIGFDLLRDRLALPLDEQVHRAFAAAVIDEADSILIDEARIPLVIAGGERGDNALAYAGGPGGAPLPRRASFHARRSPAMSRSPTPAFARWRRVRLRQSLRRRAISRCYTAVQDALHAHALLRRDVDYIVKNGVIESVDEFKGRVAQDRRWPAGLHTAIEAKEGVAMKTQGRSRVDHAAEPGCALSAGVRHDRHRRHAGRRIPTVYGLQVEVIPPNRPVIRMDHADVVFPNEGKRNRRCSTKSAASTPRAGRYWWGRQAWRNPSG